MLKTQNTAFGFGFISIYYNDTDICFASNRMENLALLILIMGLKRNILNRDFDGNNNKLNPPLKGSTVSA